MRTAFDNSETVATEIGGKLRPGQDKIVRRIFGPIARVVWPHNTDAHVAAIADCDPRSARRYLSGEIEPPGIVLAAILTEITKRD